MAPPQLPGEALPALAGAIAGLGEFVIRVKDRKSFNATDAAIAAEIQEELETVRQMVAPQTAVATGEVADTQSPQIEFAAPEVEPSTAVAKASHETAEPADVVEEAMAQPGFDPSDMVEFWDVTNRQDWGLCERAQLGAQSRGYRPGPYQPSEDCVHTFDRWYADRIQPAL